jgi:mannosyltransferase OCH1-like enzyme
MIPKVIHQTWKDELIPDHFQQLVSTWKYHNPNWEYILWTDKSNRDFISTHHPEFLATYDSYPTIIQRVDAVRYFILQKFGGVFVDIDFECFTNIEPLLKNKKCVFGLEPKPHAYRFQKKYIICNAFMACHPQNFFLQYICNELTKDRVAKHSKVIDVLESTGPLFLTNSYQQFPDKQDITLLKSEYLYPFTIEEVQNALQGVVSAAMQRKLNNAYAVHYFWGNWLNKN